MSTTADQPQPAEREDPGGRPSGEQEPQPTRRPIRRPVRGRMLAGVAAGIAEHFHVDVTIVRIAFAVLTIVGFTGPAYLGGLPLYLAGIPLYLAGWLLIPEEGSDHSIAGQFFAARRERSG